MKSTLPHPPSTTTNSPCPCPWLIHTRYHCFAKYVDIYSQLMFWRDISTSFFVAVEAPPGVYIYLGYSKKDALILQRGRVKLGKRVPDTEEEERNEVKNTIQQTVSHFTSNANKVARLDLQSQPRQQIKSMKRWWIFNDFGTFLTWNIFKSTTGKQNLFSSQTFSSWLYSRTVPPSK